MRRAWATIALNDEEQPIDCCIRGLEAPGHFDHAAALRAHEVRAGAGRVGVDCASRARQAAPAGAAYNPRWMAFLEAREVAGVEGAFWDPAAPFDESR